MSAADPFDVLHPSDPVPVEVVNRDRPSRVVLTCEHAGRALPAALTDRRPADGDMARHIAWDIGAESLARHLAARLDAPLAIQRYSRLVIDCNRPRHVDGLTPAVSDGSEIPFNVDITEDEREARWSAIHAPFHRTVGALLDQRAAGPVALVSVHSFTPRLNGGTDRPWHVGLLGRADFSLSDAMMDALSWRVPDAVTAFNEPYEIGDETDYTIPVHGEARGLPHILVEVRNDLIASDAGAAHWAGLLFDVLAAVLPAPADGEG